MSTFELNKDPEQTKFEQYLTILALVRSFGTFGIFRCADHKDIKLSDITIDFTKKYFELMDLSNWQEEIENCLPNKFIKILKPYSKFHNNELKKNIDLMTNLNKEKLKYLKSLVHDQESLIDEYLKLRLFNVPYIGKTNYDLTIFLSMNEEFIDLYKTKNFDDEFKCSNLENKIEFIKSYKNQLNQIIDTNRLSNFIIKKIDTDNEFSKKYLKNIILNITDDMVATLTYNALNDLTLTDNNYMLISCNYLWDLNCGKTSIYDNLENINKKHYEDYYYNVYSKQFPDKVEYYYCLSLEDYYELYKVNPNLLKSIIQDYCLVDDFTFCNYKYSWDFLNSLNDRVKQNIINKCNSDNNTNIKNRYGHVETLEDIVDIRIFCQFPPKFLRTDQRIYYDDYQDLLIKLLKSFNWDMNKLDYLNYDIAYTFVKKQDPIMALNC